MTTQKPPQNDAETALFHVKRGEVISHFMGDLTMLCRELEQRRTFDADIGAWFEAHPELSERFASFQRSRGAERAKHQRASAAVNAKRRARKS